MTTANIVLLPGDGIGPEVITAARALLETVASATATTLELTEIPCGGKFYLEHGSRDWPDGSEQVCRDADAILARRGWLAAPRRRGPRHDGQRQDGWLLAGDRQPH